jgi:hypothetical protein
MLKEMALAASVSILGAGCASGEVNWVGAGQGLSQGLLQSNYGQVVTYPPVMIPQQPPVNTPVVLPQRPQMRPCCR